MSQPADLKLRLRNAIKPFVPDAVLRYRARNRFRLDGYAFSGPASVSDDIRGKYGFDGDLLGIFAGHRGPVVHKWHHYIPLYDRYLSRFRGTPVRFLEIGVFKGGSLQMWRRYFGEDAVIFGVDIDPACRVHDGQAGQVRIGSQADPAFLASVVDEMGGVDVVLDDGSHEMAHLRVSLEALFPRLSDGGLYLIEDLHTAYAREYGGGYGRPGNFFGYLGEVVDDMHHWYHDRGQRHAALAGRCSGLHIHDSVAVLEKGLVHPPVHSMVG